jgi:regulator of sigma E protease
VVSVTATDSFATAAGFQVNDRVVAINGAPITDIDQLSPLVQQTKDQPIQVEIERNGARQTITAAPTLRDSGLYQFGIGLGNPLERVNPLAALWKGVTHSVTVLGDMFLGFASLIGSLLGLAPKPEGGLAGPVGIARITGAVARTGLREYLNLTAILSLNLALINILPIPALDGSRIVFALVEAVRRKKIPPEREAFVHAVGMMMLLGLMVLITVSDVHNVITGAPPISMPSTPTPRISP